MCYILDFFSVLTDLLAIYEYNKVYFSLTYNYMRAQSKLEVHIRSEARVCSELYLYKFYPIYD